MQAHSLSSVSPSLNLRQNTNVQSSFSPATSNLPVEKNDSFELTKPTATPAKPTLKFNGESDSESADEGEYEGNELHDAAFNGDLHAMQTILRSPNGKDRDFLNAPDENGDTPLHIAAYKGHVDAVRVLLGRSEVDFSQTNAEGQNALALARIKKHDLTQLGKFTVNYDAIIKLLEDKQGATNPILMQTRNPQFTRVLL